MNVWIDDRLRLPMVTNVEQSKIVDCDADVRVVISNDDPKSRLFTVGEILRVATSGDQGNIISINKSDPDVIVAVVRPLNWRSFFRSAGSNYLLKGELIEIISVEVITQKESIDRMNYSNRSSARSNTSSNSSADDATPYKSSSDDYRNSQLDFGSNEYDTGSSSIDSSPSHSSNDSYDYGGGDGGGGGASGSWD